MDQLQDRVMSDGRNRAAEDKQGKSVGTATRQAEPFSIRNSDRNEQTKIKREPSPRKNPPTSVKREAHAVKTERDIKYETPLSNRVGSRSTTPATGSTDKRKLLPIPDFETQRRCEWQLQSLEGSLKQVESLLMFLGLTVDRSIDSTDVLVYRVLVRDTNSASEAILLLFTFRKIGFPST